MGKKKVVWCREFCSVEAAYHFVNKILTWPKVG
jgi:hypothetical protein